MQPPDDPSPYKVNLSSDYAKALQNATRSEKSLKKLLSPIRGKEEVRPPDPTFLTDGTHWTPEQLKYIEQYPSLSLEDLLKSKNAMILALQKELAHLKSQLDDIAESSKKTSGNSLFLKERVAATNSQRQLLLDQMTDMNKRMKDYVAQIKSFESKNKELEKANRKLKTQIDSLELKYGKVSKELTGFLDETQGSSAQIEYFRTMKLKALSTIKQLFKPVPSITTLTLRFMEVEDGFVPTIIRIAEQIGSIQTLDLEGNLLTDKAAKVIADFLGKPKGRVTRLNLDFNNIGIDGAWFLAESIRERDQEFLRFVPTPQVSTPPQKIEEIRLSHNRIKQSSLLYGKIWDVMKKGKEPARGFGLKNASPAKNIRLSSTNPAPLGQSIADLEEVKGLTSVLDRIIIENSELTPLEEDLKAKEQRWTVVAQYQSEVMKEFEQDIDSMLKKTTFFSDPIEKDNLVSTIFANEDKTVRSKLLLGREEAKKEQPNAELQQDFSLKQLFAQRPGFPLTYIEERLSAGLDVNSVDPATDETFLLYGCRIGNLKLVQLVLRKAADLEWRNVLIIQMRGENAFLIACKHNNFDIMDFLIFSGCKINSVDSQGANALHSAAKNGDHDLICRLVERGLSVNWVDNIGRAPLHYAAEKGDMSTVVLLIQLGAEVNLPDASGRLPATFAEENNHFEVLDKLQTIGKAGKEDRLRRPSRMAAEVQLPLGLKDESKS